MNPLTLNIPKPLIKIGKHSLLERSINLLIEYGVKELVINSGKAKEKLDWVPKYEMEETIQEIINWEKNYIKAEGPEFSLKQIKKYIERS